MGNEKSSCAVHWIAPPGLNNDCAILFNIREVCSVLIFILIRKERRSQMLVFIFLCLSNRATMKGTGWLSLLWVLSKLGAGVDVNCCTCTTMF